MANQSSALDRGLTLLGKLEDWLLVSLLGMMVFSSAGQIISRNLFGGGFAEADQFARLMVLWVAMLGAVVAARSDKHINVDVLSRILSKVNQVRVKVLIHLLSVAVCLVITVKSFQFIVAEFEAGSKAFASVPGWLAQSVIPFGFALISLHYLLLAVAEWRGNK